LRHNDPVTAVGLGARIISRADLAGATISPELATRLGDYLALLARWNTKINLTGLPVDPPTDEAIDRLIVEPVVAARHIAATDAVVVDVGSGGGSPAIPLKLMVPALRFILVEARARKAAFLREAVRRLQLTEMSVECARLEDIVSTRMAVADVVTLRAVRVDANLRAAVAAVARTSGRIFVFTSAAHPPCPEGWTCEGYALTSDVRSRLCVCVVGRQAK
jgi:16S rRNA (guanine527-N7)-methyltransferase